jgi:6-phospho-beta-glucosidase
MAGKRLRVVVIGGGSSYTPEIIEGLLTRRDSLPLAELWLTDIPSGKEKLDIIAALSRRMVHKYGDPFQIRTTLDREEALDGADFVLSQIRVGSLDARIRDERIPMRYGALGQETVGAGGFSKALRTTATTRSTSRTGSQASSRCPSRTCGSSSSAAITSFGAIGSSCAART